MTPAAPRPPSHLSSASRAWWSRVVHDYQLDQHHLKLLTLAAESWDRCVQARKVLDKHGITYVDRFHAPRLRPEAAVERDSKIAFARLLRQLDLDHEAPPETPRLPPLGGLKD